MPCSIPAKGPVILLGCLLLLGCGDEGRQSPRPRASAGERPARDVVLISVDTLRHDTLGYAGHEVRTPAIDRLAAAGRVFTNARAHAVMTTPSHLSMLTGLNPDQHGVRDNGGFVLDAGIPTIATLLAAEGFATGGFVGAYPLAGEKGFSRGFEVYDDIRIDAAKGDDLLLGLPNPRAGVGSRSGQEVAEAALEWWLRNADRRRFLFVHVYDPHAPYDPPSPFKEQYADPYHGEIAWTDHFLAPLIDRLLDPQAEADGAPLVIFTSDHGEAFGEHGEPTHGYFAYEPTLRVPLVIAGGGFEPGLDARNARHVDLLPTLLDALGFETPATDAAEGAVGPGRSLLEHGIDWQQEATYFESLSPFYNFGWAPLRGIVQGDHKLIEQPIPELYHVSEDPAEAVNRIDDDRATARRLLDLLPTATGFGLDERSMDDEERARLAALGYLDARRAQGESIADFGPEDDLKNVIVPYRQLRDLVAWLHDGRHDDVVRAARDLRRHVPDSPLLYSCWVAALIRGGDLEGSVTVIREAITEDAATSSLRRQLGISLMRLGRPEEAVRALETEAARVPSDLTLNVLGHAHLQGGDAAAAQAVFERAAETYPRSTRAPENLSFLRLQQGDAAGAERWARRALEIADDAPGAWNNLGLALFELGQARSAVDAWKRSLELDPDDPDVLFNHGLVCSELGELEAAARSLRRFLEQGPSAADPRAQEARRLLLQAGPG